MTAEPFQRFLGVDESADAMTLLGLSSSQLNPVNIEASLRDRLGRVYRHPEGRSDEADMVRHALRAAADQLRQRLAPVAVEAPESPTPQRPNLPRAASPVFQLTEFDRMVLAVLVANGGWNVASREKLVALAANHDVGVAGLMRVVQGLTTYARAGGPHLGVAEITAGRRLVPTTSAPGPAGVPVGSAILDRLTENLATELRRDDPWPTIKLSVIFAVLTLIVGIIGLKVVFSNADRDHLQPDGDSTAAVASTATSPSTRPVSGTDPNQPRVARFPKTPTFLGNGLPMEAVNAADQYPGLPAQFEEIARRLSISTEPAEVLYRNWIELIRITAEGWVLADSSSRQAVDRAMLDALRAAADTPAISDRLLAALAPAAGIAEPLDVWRGSWCAGTLGAIAASNSLPAIVVERARSQMEVALKQKLPTGGFEPAAREWLNQRLTQLVTELEFDDHAYDKWELWITAQRSLGRDAQHDEAIMKALVAVTETETDLSRPGPTVNVAARLLGIAVEHPSETSKSRLLAMFDAAKISNRDLWVLTSLMVHADAAPWFAERLVVPEDADQGHRWRIRDDIAKAWPATAMAASAPAAAAGVVVDATVGHRWIAQLDSIVQQPISRTPETALRQLIAANRMVQAAAALAAQNPVLADRVLDDVETTMADIDAGPTPVSSATPATPVAATPHAPPAPSVPGAAGRPPAGTIRPPGPSPDTTLTPGGKGKTPGTPPGKKTRPPGQPLGRDGEWAAAYQQLGKKLDERLDALRALRATAGTDLGPIDAEAFVHEVYRGSPQEIRSIAQAVVVQQLETGPNIAMEMLDQFADAPATDSISSTIEGLCGRTLPTVRNTGWRVEARLALVLHALSLKPEGRSDLDQLTEAIIDSYAHRIALLAREGNPSVAPRTAQDAAALELAAWNNKAGLTMSDTPFPDTLAGLQRRHATRVRLAEGPIQNLVAQQLGILDLLTYITVAERPDIKPAAMALLHKSAEQRSRSAGVIEQAVEIERATARMWQLRLNVNRSPSDGQPGGSSS